MKWIGKIIGYKLESTCKFANLAIMLLLLPLLYDMLAPNIVWICDYFFTKNDIIFLLIPKEQKFV